MLLILYRQLKKVNTCHFEYYWIIHLMLNHEFFLHTRKHI